MHAVVHVDHDPVNLHALYTPNIKNYRKLERKRTIRRNGWRLVIDFKFNGVCNADFDFLYLVPRKTLFWDLPLYYFSAKKTPPNSGKLGHRGILVQIFQNTSNFAELGAFGVVTKTTHWYTKNAKKSEKIPVPQNHSERFRHPHPWRMDYFPFLGIFVMWILKFLGIEILPNSTTNIGLSYNVSESNSIQHLIHDYTRSLLTCHLQCCLALCLT